MQRIADRYDRAVQEQATRGKKYRFKPGRNIIRILPAVGKMDFPWKESGMHYSLGPQKDQSEFCPRLTNGDECPICKLVDQLYREGTNEEKKQARELKATRRFYFNIIVREHEDLGVRVLESPETVWTDILGLYADEDDPIELHNEENGHDVVVIRRGEGLNTEYTTKVKRQPCPISDNGKQAAKWLEECEDLNEYVVVQDYDFLDELLYGPKEGDSKDGADPAKLKAAEKEVEEELEDPDDPEDPVEELEEPEDPDDGAEVFEDPKEEEEEKEEEKEEETDSKAASKYDDDPDDLPHTRKVGGAKTRARKTIDDELKGRSTRRGTPRKKAAAKTATTRRKRP